MPVRELPTSRRNRRLESATAVAVDRRDDSSRATDGISRGNGFGRAVHGGPLEIITQF
jgi:hypothetical protein